MTQFTSTLARAGAITVAALLAVTLVACAPELGDAAGLTDKDTESVNPETSWGETDTEEEDVKVGVLPESFPSDEFALPEGAHIDNAGERGVDRWFVVLLAADEAEADAVWASIIELNGFGVTDEGESIEGGVFATLNGITLTTQAATLVNEDGSVLLSYDITRWA